MDSIEKPPENNFQIIGSDDNKPIFIDPQKYPSPHMIIYNGM
jgi:hypothetical protein